MALVIHTESVLVIASTFTNKWYLTGNAGFTVSEYEGSDGVKRSTTYDLGPQLYVSAGKEWPKPKEYGVRTWGVNLSVIYNGGMTEGVIDPFNSQLRNRTEYVEGTRGEMRLDGYFRSDMRIYFRKDKAKRTSTISLDIQNLFNVRNAWFSNYDIYYNEVRQGDQLGFIPVLNWRLDF